MGTYIVLAPLLGITNHIFRNTYVKYFSGLDACVSPFISAHSVKKPKEKTVRDILPEHNRLLKTTPQLIGNDADDFLQLARFISGHGYREINWNLGCPYPRVAKKQRGAGLLNQPQRIDSFLNRFFLGSDLKLSVKVRLGLEEDGELTELMPIFNRYPLSKIIVHPRTGQQRYQGNVNLERFAEIIKLSKHKVVYNGDIFSYKDFENIRNRFPAIKEFMLGRGVLSNPHLPKQIKSGVNDGCSVEPVRNFIWDLYRTYRTVYYGPGPVLGKMKEIWSYLAVFLTDDKKYLKKILRAASFNQYENGVKTIFELKNGRH